MPRVGNVSKRRANTAKLVAACDLLKHPYYNFPGFPRLDDPVNYDQQTSAFNSSAKVTFMRGGNGCIAPEQEIYDPVTNLSKQVQQISEPFHVWAIDNTTGQVVIALASIPWVKGRDDLYRIFLSNGQSFIATLDHRVLTTSGWLSLSACGIGEQLLLSLRHRQFDAFQHPSNLEPFLQVFQQDADRLSHTPQDCQERYWLGHRRYDGRLLLVADNGPEFFPLSTCAREHSQSYLQEDAHYFLRECSHACQLFGHRAKTHCVPSALPFREVHSPSFLARNLCISGSVYNPVARDYSNKSPTLLYRDDQQFLAETFLIDTISKSVQRATASHYEPSYSLHQVQEKVSRECYITGIEFVRQGTYYDLEVPQFHNYWMNGIFHHNSGKTLTAARKCARFVMEVQAPPRLDTPFMIVSDTYEQVGNICWKEKLSRFIPDQLIDHDRCQWQNKARGLPYVVALKPWPGLPGRTWNLEFRSLDQGRRHFQGRAFGGFWFSEQFEWEIFDEVVRGCRDTWYDGAHFAEFTPIDPDLTVGYEERMENPPPGWVEYRMNVDKNTAVSSEWRESFLASTSEEMRETRRTGELLNLAGAIYRNFNPAVHVLDEYEWSKLTGCPMLGGKLLLERYCTLAELKTATPLNVFFRRGIDWGESPEHPFVCLWGWKDGAGNWFIFDEYIEATGLVTYQHRRNEIKDRYPWSDIDPHFGMCYADPSRPLLIQEFTIDGIMTAPASNAVHDGIEYLRTLIQPNIVTGKPMLYILKSNCPRLARGMRKYRWLRSFKPGIMTDRRMNPTAARMEPLKYQDDEVDCARYMIFSDRQRSGVGPSFTSAPTDGQRHGVRITGRYDGRE